jgi:hypothetical protein
MRHGPEIEARSVREVRTQVSAHHQREIEVLESNTGTGRERRAIPPGCVDFGSARKESKQNKGNSPAIFAPTLSDGDYLGGECGPSLQESFVYINIQNIRTANTNLMVRVRIGLEHNFCRIDSFFRSASSSTSIEFSIVNDSFSLLHSSSWPRASCSSLNNV